MRRFNPAPLFFALLSIIAFYYSDMSALFVANEVIIRIIRNSLLVFALIIPVTAGMGLNFSIIIGAMAAQAGWIFMLDLQVPGILGIAGAALSGIFISVICGYIIGSYLNRVKGREMIATIIIGILGAGIYQFIFLVGYGTFIPAHNSELLLSRGAGIRDMVDLAPYRNIIDRLWLVDIGGIQLPFFMFTVVAAAAIAVKLILLTPAGQRFRAVGSDRGSAELSGINTDRTRIQAMIISTVLACLGQIIFLQNIGMVNVYTAHMNSDIFSCAALLAGGATIKEAKIRHALLGIVLFHSLYIVTPQAGQNIFSNAVLGEYFRSFIAYGSIAIALIINIRHERGKQ
ncbi:MAG TPA: ABC transporter permease [Spirochaetota bacterium]|nr:ABC transporter permease [Spirochaetota bacterium]HPF07609.1 ABC transporter permease [Spirochaetota bacterium]HPR38078.1 ABC transporter permease [Spirochaetota bacterium]HRX48218.1 ABC transporter permease [Spirochaetota bacterium]